MLVSGIVSTDDFIRLCREIKFAAGKRHAMVDEVEGRMGGNACG